MNFTTKFKINLIILIMTIGILFIGSILYYALNNSIEKFKIVTNEKFPIAIEISKLKQIFSELKSKVFESLTTYDNLLINNIKECETIKNELYNQFDILKKNYNNNIIVSKFLNQIETLHKNFISTITELLQLQKKIDEYIVINNIPVPLSSFMREKELDHVRWLSQLESDINAKCEFKGQINPNLCAFGKWFNNFQPKNNEIKNILDKFKIPHEQLHNSSHKINECLKNNQFDNAINIFNTETKTFIKELLILFQQTFTNFEKQYQTTLIEIENTKNKLNNLILEFEKLYSLINNEINNEVVNFITNSKDSFKNILKFVIFVIIIILLIALIIGYITNKNIYTIIEILSNECLKVSNDITNGQLNSICDIQKINFEFRPIVIGINNIIEAFVKPIKVTSEYINQISKGKIPPKITEEYKGEFNKVKENLNKCIDTLKNLVSDANKLAVSAINGNFNIRINSLNYQGDYQELAKNMNELIEAFVKPLNTTIKYLEDLSSGIVNENIKEEYKGEFNRLKTSFNKCFDAMRLMLKDVNMLIDSALDGNLSVRADHSKHEGDYRKIIEGINKMLDALLKPIDEALRCLEEMASGNLNIEMTGNYSGDHVRIKNALNKTIDSINDILKQIIEMAENVKISSNQLTDASSSLSKAATEQASSIEEISEKIQQISSQSKLNAENAQQASKLSTEFQNYSENGNQKMQDMKRAMQEINEASENVSKIIKSIEEIAFQTNLLALNAAVEAARAGKHGKGFTVVAEEVRNLAQRSAKAAKETAEMIANSVKRVESGLNIADETTKALELIVIDTMRVTSLINEVAAATSEQEMAIEQVSNRLTQIDHTIQQNTSVAEQTASAAQNLLNQATTLKETLLKFKLKNYYNLTNNELNNEEIKLLE